MTTPPSKADFINAFRFELLGLLFESIIAKKEGKELGMDMELKRQKIHKLLGDAYDLLVPPPEIQPPSTPPKATAAGTTQPRK